MKQLYVTDRDKWRNWLSENHATETGVWLVFYKKETSKPTIAYDAAVGKVRGEDVFSKNWWRDEALNLALSAGFAIKDVASGDVFRAEQSQMRKELGLKAFAK